MFLFSIALMTFLVVALSIDRLRKSAAVRVGLATAFLGTQLFVLAVSFDVAGRTVMDEQDRGIKPLANFEDGVRSLRDGLYPYRASLALMSVGLFLLIVAGTRRSNGTDQS
jgi:hypothetical protein